MCFIRSCAKLMLASGIIFPTWAGAQAPQTIDVARIPECKECKLTPRLITQLGDSTGPGIIAADFAEVRFSPETRQYAVFHIPGSNILLFDAGGKFLRAIGHKGEGPAEISQIIDAHFSGRNLVVLNRTGPRFMVMDLDGKVHNEATLRIRRGKFAVASESTLVLGSMDRSAALVGYPLHLVRVRTGEAVKHFGSVDGEWSTREPWAEAVLLGVGAATKSIWKGQPTPFRLEEWRIDGQLVRTVEGEGRWFPRGMAGGRSGPPLAFVLAFGVDPQDRLWTVSRVPDKRWKEVPTRGQEGYVLPEDFLKYFDTRVDMFDLRTQRHLGSLTWDEPYAGITMIGGKFALQRVVDDDGVPRIALYDLALGTSR